ncbi:MAG TPA: folylpolyglutamate synthase/dihydrofolate synthase family protein [Acidobacteriota bacterium]|nr:folylpolyglutamate synthase/dihydrofolate synthase family protein [Acidobacteriota bacterium]
MNYQESLNYLERLGNEVLTMRFGLETMEGLLAHLGHPELSYPSILVAGTNGKGSVARFLNSVLDSCGLRTGLYTSPHLVKVLERFVCGRQTIDPESFAGYLSRVVEAIEGLNLPGHPTFFETLTAVAFLFFKERKVDLAVLEVGMGGRLDSTNVVDPVLSIITPIGMDHMQYLGDTVEEIAREKAGIMRKNRPILVAPQTEPVDKVLREEARRHGSHLEELDLDRVEVLDSTDGRYCFRYHGQSFQLPVYGHHQVQNAVLAIRATEILNHTGFELPLPRVRDGIESSVLAGALQKICSHPAVFLDGGHNPDAARLLADFVVKHTKRPRALVMGMMKDKDYCKVLGILSSCMDQIFFTRIDSERALDPRELRTACPRGQVVERPEEAYHQALQGAKTVIVTGSFYLVGQILRSLGRQASEA